MTATTDAKAVAPSANAIKLSTGAGANVVNLQALLVVKLVEAQILVKQILALTPSGDSSLTALTALLSELL